MIRALQLPWIAGLAVVVAVGSTQAAEKHTLLVQPSKHPVNLVEVEIEVGGDLKTAAQVGKTQALKMSVVGAMRYEEKHLAGDAPGLAGLRSIRFYEEAKAAIKVEKDAFESTLPEDRRLVAAEYVKVGGSALLFSPSGPLTRNQLDLIDCPANSLVLHGVLPEQPVAVGETWTPANDFLAALLGLDAVGKAEVEAKLVSVADDQATVEANGSVNGAVGGVATEMEIKTKWLIDLKAGRIAKFGLAVKENRSIGHVAPGLDVVARIRVTFTPMSEPIRLTDSVLSGVPQTSEDAVVGLQYIAPAQDVRFYHSRNWYEFSNNNQLMMMRMVNAGELTAQCNLHRLQQGSPGGHVTFEKFRDGVREALGDKFESFVKAAKIPHDAGYTVYQVVARGQSANLPIEWRYYMVASPTGQQSMFIFTIEQPLIDRLGDQDLEMVGSFAFLKGPEPTPAPATVGPAAAPKTAEATGGGNTESTRK